MMEEEIADFHRRKAQYEAEKMNSGHHTLTLGKLGKKKQDVKFQVDSVGHIQSNFDTRRLTIKVQWGSKGRRDYSERVQF